MHKHIYIYIYYFFIFVLFERKIKARWLVITITAFLLPKTTLRVADLIWLTVN